MMQEMKYTVKFLKKKGIVVGKIIGTITLESAKSYLLEMSRIARENGVNRILTDTTESVVEISDEKSFELSDSLGQMGISSNFKRAVLIKSDVRFFKLWENLNLKKGNRDMKLFVAEDLAEDWLCAG